MRRPKLAAFHVAMVPVYVAIIWAYEAGWTRLGFALWAAALGTCLAMLLACVAIMHAAWRSSGRPATFLWWLRHELEKWWIGSADGAAPPPSEEFDLKAPDNGMVAGMSDDAGGQPGFGASDGQPARTQPPVDGPDGLLLLGDRPDGKLPQESVQG